MLFCNRGLKQLRCLKLHRISQGCTISQGTANYHAGKFEAKKSEEKKGIYLLHTNVKKKENIKSEKNQREKLSIKPEVDNVELLIPVTTWRLIRHRSELGE